MKHLIVISGPTASGKTSLSIALAKHFNTCVVSADSRQFYKELSIGTAKPSLEEQDGVKHHFIDSHSVSEEMTSAMFERAGLAVLEEEFSDKDVVILAGGSGMFIDALCIGLDDIPSSKELRAELQLELDENGLNTLLKELEEKDPEYYEVVDRDNPMRITRALEAIRLTGKTFSEQRSSSVAERPFEIHRYVIDHDRDVLYNRINMRVDQMMEAGLLEEAKSVLRYRNLTTLNTVGYKELFEYIDGNLSLDEAIELIKRNTRHYAKRQLTWFRRHPESEWIPYTSINEMSESIIEHFETKRRTINQL